MKIHNPFKLISADGKSKKAQKLLKMNKYHDSLRFAKEAIKIDPRNCEGWDCLSQALFQLERYEEALNAIDTALQINPDRNPSLWIHRGNYLSLLGFGREAEQAYHNARQIPKNRMKTRQSVFTRIIER
jgi:tetratricopeptide (TPR) repeat protein